MTTGGQAGMTRPETYSQNKGRGLSPPSFCIPIPTNRDYFDIWQSMQIWLFVMILVVPPLMNCTLGD